MKEVIEYMKNGGKHFVFLTKTNPLGSAYWFDYIYIPGNINKTVYALRSNFGYKGFKGNPSFGTALIEFEIGDSDGSLTLHGVDLKKWKKSMGNKRYERLTKRMREHSEL